MKLVYLDNAATTPLAPEVRAAMEPWLGEAYGNPSSRHPLGVRAAEAVEEARRAVAAAVGARPDGVVFTSGGTEADNLAVLGLARAAGKRRRHVLVGPTEHPAVGRAAEALGKEGFEVETARLDADGALDLDDLAARLRPDTCLVAQMLVNNEFGAIYDVARVARLVRANAPGAGLHVDAVQGLGKLDVSLGELGADSLALSAHKLHGPQGVGALILAPDARPQPLVYGGNQEHGLRSGTENVAGVVGMGVAVRLAAERRVEAAAHALRLRGLLEEQLTRVHGARLLAPGGADGAVPSIAAVLLSGPPAEVWMHHLETAGVMTSVGSACQARARELSPALLALGLDQEEARRVLRVSFARSNTGDDVRALGDALVATAAALEVHA
jgi:cysteine desulfurase